MRGRTMPVPSKWFRIFYALNALIESIWIVPTHTKKKYGRALGRWMLVELLVLSPAVGYRLASELTTRTGICVEMVSKYSLCLRTDLFDHVSLWTTAARLPNNRDQSWLLRFDSLGGATESVATHKCIRMRSLRPICPLSLSPQITSSSKLIRQPNSYTVRAK